MNKKTFRAELGSLFVLAGAVLIFFWPAALLRETFFLQDVMVQNYPFRHFFGEALKTGRLPLWNPAINCGFPLFAEGQAGVFYPFNLLTYLLLPTFAALNYNILFHFWLAGASVYFFLRTIGVGRAAGLTGGLAYACGGFLVLRAMSPNYIDVSAWMPALFLLLELGMRRRRGAVFLLLAGGVVGLQMLAGHPQAAAYSLLAAMAYGVYRGVAQRAGWRYLVWVLLGLPLIGGGLAAIQLLPTAELVGWSARGSGLSWEQFVSMSLPPERLVTLLLPNFFGNPGTGSYWGQRAGFFIQLGAYGGILPLLLGLAALCRRKDGYTDFFGVLCGLGLVLALGKYTAVFEVLYQIPGLSAFRIPTRFLLWFALGMAMLAGLGMEELLSGAALRRGAVWWWGCLLLGLAGGMVWLNWEVLWAGSSFLLQLGGERLVRYGRDLRFDVARLVVLLVAGGWALTWRGGRRRRQILAIVVPLLVFLDLYSFGRGFNGLIDPAVYLEPPQSAQAIVADAGGERVVRPRIISMIAEQNSPYDWHHGWMLDLWSYQKYPQTLRMYSGGLYGLENALPGWSPLHLRRHWEFMRGYMGFANLAGVEYVVTYQPLSRPGLEAVFDGEVKVYRNLEAWPRAYLTTHYQVIETREARLRHLRHPNFSVRPQVVLEEDPGVDQETGEATVSLTHYDNEEVVVRLEGCGGGILVLSDTHYPGWEAWVDGKPAPILRANHVFRAVVVPEGARQVVFRFVSRAFRTGAWLSAISWIALAVMILVCWRRASPSLAPVPFVRLANLKGWALQGLLILVLHGLITRWPLWAEALTRSRVMVELGG